MPHSHRAGVTLIEVLGAVALILLLAGVVVPTIHDKVEQARELKAAGDMRRIAEAFNGYKLDTGSWPSNERFDPTVTQQGNLVGFACLYQNTFQLRHWAGPYLDQGFRVDESTTHIAPPQPEAAADVAKESAIGFLDPWGQLYSIFYFERGFNSSQGCIAIVCKGSNGELDTLETQAWGGQPAEDDSVQIVTRRL